jgi:hypothetical protein
MMRGPRRESSDRRGETIEIKLAAARHQPETQAGEGRAHPLFI